MAMELNTKTTEKIKDQVQKERNAAFLAVKIVCVVATILFAGFSLYSGFTAYQAAGEADARYGELNREYEQLKADVDAWHEEYDSKPDAVTDEGESVEYKEMYSALSAGMEVAALQNLYYRDKELLKADRERLNELCHKTEIWIGAGWDPAETPIRWEFATFYDYKPDATSVSKTYDVAWECWHEAPSGTMYLIAVQFGSYDVETGTFRLTANSFYRTDFERMLNSKGAVEAGEPVVMDFPVGQVVDELMSGGGTGTIPIDDPGVSADILGDYDIAGGPAGGGAQ